MQNGKPMWLTRSHFLDPVLLTQMIDHAYLNNWNQKQRVELDINNYSGRLANDHRPPKPKCDLMTQNLCSTHEIVLTI